MIDTKHTPLTVNETGWPSIQRDGVNIAKTDCSIGGEPWEMDHAKALQNARDLVHRYNTHPELLEALEGLMEWNGVYDAAVAHARFPSLAEHFMERGDAARKALATARA